MNNSKPHILFLPEWYPNPHDKQLAIFVEKYARAVTEKYQISLIYCGPFAEKKDEFFVKNENGIYRLHYYYTKTSNKLSAYRKFIKAHRFCYNHLTKEKGKPALVHLHMLFRNFVAYNKIYKKYIPDYLITEQWSGYLNGVYEKLPFAKKRLYQKAFYNAKLVTSVSVLLKNRLQKLFNTKTEFVIVPNIVERSTKEKQKLNSTIKILVVADLVDDIKNISGVIRAFNKSSIANSAQLTIAGDGKDRKMLESISINSNVRFVGRLVNEEVLDLMLQHDFLITNSRHETFSMVTAEALLAGLPVICTRCGGPEEFLDNSNSILINVDDENDLINAMQKMSNRFNDFDRLKMAEPVLKKFGITAVAEMLHNCYQKILNKK